jgi:tetratricopeptide (TPR) repeat protein
MLNRGPLLGRDREIAALDGAVLAAFEQGAALLVIGEPGIGKSALLAVAQATATAAGCTVLRAAGVESETHLPFGGLHQTLAPLLRHLPGLPRAQRDAVATAFGLADGANPDLFLIAEASVALVLRERVERPLVVVVDDMHWLDPQSHQILAFLAHRGIGAGISVIATIRPEHAGPFANAAFPQLQVAGVDDSTAEAILQAHGGVLNATDLKRIRREAQGNPLALLELPRSWDDGPPVDGQSLAVSARLERAFAGRVAELPAGTRDALLVAAVGSSSHTDEIVRALSAFGTPDAARELFAPAVGAGLVTAQPLHIDFRHPLVRSGVLQRESLTRRHAAHAALAEVLDADRYRQTWHRAWSIVGPDDDVADALAATVPDSLRRGAVMSAVSSLERAAQLTSSSTQRGERLLLAAGRAFEAGRADVVDRLLREAAQIDLAALDHARATWLTEALNDDVRADSSLVRHLCASAVQADARGDPGLALNLLLATALRCWWADSGAEDRAEIVRILDGMTALRADPRHLAALAVAEPVLRGSEVTRSLASTALEEVAAGDSLRVYGMAAYAVGDLVLATDLLDRAEEAFRAEGRLGMLPVVLALQLHIRLDLGDWSGAVLAGREVVTVSRETGQAVFAENNILVEARGMALRGDWQAALDAMAATQAQAVRLRINDRICFGYHARGAALLSANRPAEAFACLQRQFDPADPGYHLRESFAGIALMAEAAVACGRVDEARGIVRGLETVAVLTPSPLLVVNLLYARAVLAPAQARDGHYRDALARDLTRWPWLRARLELAYGQWLVETGRWAGAEAKLRVALEVFERLGAARWVHSALRCLQQVDGRGSGSA